MKTNKKLYFDTETTGVVQGKHEIIEIAGIIEIDDVVEREFKMKCQPTDWDAIDPKALEVHGHTREKLKTFKSAKWLYENLKQGFSEYINPFDKSDKFKVCGFNVDFDIGMLASFFLRQKDPYVYSFLGPYPLDVMKLAIWMNDMKLIQTENMRLETIANYFRVKINAHDSLSDIRATREIALKMKKMILGASKKVG